MIPAAAVVKYLPTFLAAAQRLAALWLRFRARGKGWPRVARKRPLAGPQDGCAGLLEVCGWGIVGGAMVFFLAGCASLSKPGPAELEQIRALCEEVSPCEPCPPAPVCPEPMKCPDIASLPVAAADGCDRDGLPPDGATIWKPLSDNESRLAVVVGYPLVCEGGVRVRYGKGQKKQELARHPGGQGANGCRYAYRFSRPGAQFGRGILVECLGEAGEVLKEWKVPNGANRTEFRGR